MLSCPCHFQTDCGSQSKIRVPRSQAAPVHLRPPTYPGKVISQFKPESDNGTVIAIGASTGGTEAILEVLKQVSVNMPGIVITQHARRFHSHVRGAAEPLCKLEGPGPKGGG